MPVKDEILVPQNKDTSFDGDVLPGEDGRWNFGSLTKRWREVIAKVGRFINLVYTGNLKPTRDGETYTAYAFVPLSTFLTNSDFNGDSFSDVASNTKIENTSWSTAIPAEARALLIYGYARDSASASTSGLYFALYPTSTATQAAINWTIGGKPNDDWEAHTAVMPCTDGDIWYKVEASGTNTLDVYLYCWGYFI